MTQNSPATKTSVWKAILATLTAEISQGQYRAGEKIPTESALAARFGVNRHTVRRAIAEMSGRGLVHARRGAGVFVASVPTEYPMGRRIRFTQNIAAMGRMPEKTVLTLQTRRASVKEAAALDLTTAEMVHVYEGISLVDGAPVALARSVFPAVRLPHFLDHLRQDPSITAAFAREGIQDYTRASTRLTAKLATATQALHLRIPEGAPILRTININVDPQGHHIEYGTTWFAGDRVTLTITPDGQDLN
jgi:GntR family phosphonate transport system transcriptional regulator